MEELRKEILHQYTFLAIISKNEEIIKIFSILPDIAASESTVLIEGLASRGTLRYGSGNYPAMWIWENALPAGFARRNAPARCGLGERNHFFLADKGWLGR